MQNWNKDFYQSKAWQDCRVGYLISRHFTCERCADAARIAHHKTPLTPANIHDLTIALGHDNLEALCQTCHNAEHHKRHEPCRHESVRYTFGTAGQLVEPPHPDGS